MTLGKIERFWKSLLGEFLQRAQFDSFEQAVERTALWVKYYNHKRPHQGVGGLCPADRFFEIAHELKQTIEKGIEENALELALRGRPVDPFYYRLPPLASHWLPCGEEVAGHLQYLFDRFESPLFCKRDNAGNLNHLAVNQVLEEALVIPINSPPYRAPYNGGIEHTQGEFKSYLARWSWKAGTVDRMALLSETAAHDLNHQPRRCLGGKTACRAYFGGPRICYPRRKRASVYRFIQDLAAEVATRAGKSVITPTAWRVAARQWLVKNGLIRIQKAGEVSPNFCQKNGHN